MASITPSADAELILGVEAPEPVDPTKLVTEARQMRESLRTMEVDSARSAELQKIFGSSATIFSVYDPQASDKLHPLEREFTGRGVKYVVPSNTEGSRFGVIPSITTMEALINGRVAPPDRLSPKGYLVCEVPLPDVPVVEGLPTSKPMKGEFRIPLDRLNDLLRPIETSLQVPTDKMLTAILDDPTVKPEEFPKTGSFYVADYLKREASREAVHELASIAWRSSYVSGRQRSVLPTASEGSTPVPVRNVAHYQPSKTGGYNLITATGETTKYTPEEIVIALMQSESSGDGDLKPIYMPIMRGFSEGVPAEDIVSMDKSVATQLLYSSLQELDIRPDVFIETVRNTKPNGNFTRGAATNAAFIVSLVSRMSTQYSGQLVGKPAKK